MVGEKVLKKIALKIKDNIRKMDAAGRIGSVEILIIFSETDIKEAERIINRIRREKIERVKITFSAGLYQHNLKKQKN